MKNGDLKRFYPVHSQEEKDFVRYDDNGNILVGRAIKDNDAMSKKDVLDAIGTAQMYVYKPGGSRAFADLGLPSEKRLGYVYNITDDFTTNLYFLEGPGIKYPAGTDVTVITENDHYYFATYVGRFDYDILDNVPIINVDLDDEDITLTPNMYYRHMTETPEDSDFIDGRIYLYDGTDYWLIDGHFVRTINGSSPDSNGDVSFSYVATINDNSPDSNGNIDLSYVATINNTTPDNNGNIDLSYVSSVNSVTPDNNGDVSLSYISTINNEEPDNNRNITLNYISTINNASPDNNKNININAVPTVPVDYASKTYQLETLSNGAYAWAEKAHLYQHFLEITTSSDSGTHIYIQFVAASAIPATSPDALKGLLSAATNGINANGYAASSGIGHTALVKISAVDNNNFVPTLISTTGSISTGSNIAYNTLTIVDTVIQIL